MYDPRKHGARCDACPRRGQVVVPPEGPKQGARWCWLGQDPGPTEVRKGRPFIGPTGTRLTRIWESACEAIGYPAIQRQEIWITNACLCIPLTPSAKEARDAATCCRPRLSAELARLHPDAGILAMGKWALFALTGKEKGMGGFQGFHLMLDAKKIVAEAKAAAALLVAKKPKTKKKDLDDIPF